MSYVLSPRQVVIYIHIVHDIINNGHDQALLRTLTLYWKSNLIIYIHQICISNPSYLYVVNVHGWTISKYYNNDGLMHKCSNSDIQKIVECRHLK